MAQNTGAHKATGDTTKTVKVVETTTKPVPAKGWVTTSTTYTVTGKK